MITNMIQYALFQKALLIFRYIKLCYSPLDVECPFMCIRCVTHRFVPRDYLCKQGDPIKTLDFIEHGSFAVEHNGERINTGMFQ
jgi:hypothetical protein